MNRIRLLMASNTWVALVLEDEVLEELTEWFEDEDMNCRYTISVDSIDETTGRKITTKIKKQAVLLMEIDSTIYNDVY